MALIEWDTDKKQQQLLKMLKKEDIDNPSNLVVENTVQFSIENRYPVTRLRFFSTKYDEVTTPTYVFIVEENNAGEISIFARPPTHEHNRALLEEALDELLAKLDGHLTNHGEMRIRSDTFTRDVLSYLTLAKPLILVHCSTTAVFQNTTAFEAAKRSPYVTMWEEKIENNNEEEASGSKREKTYFPIHHAIIKSDHQEQLEFAYC